MHWMLLYNFFYVLYGWQNILIMICGLPLSSGTCAPSLISLIVISFNNSITTLSINIVEKFEIKFVWCAGYESEPPRRRSGFDPGCILLFYFVFFENSFSYSSNWMGLIRLLYSPHICIDFADDIKPKLWWCEVIVFLRLINHLSSLSSNYDDCDP